MGWHCRWKSLDVIGIPWKRFYRHTGRVQYQWAKTRAQRWGLHVPWLHRFRALLLELRSDAPDGPARVKPQPCASRKEHTWGWDSIVARRLGRCVLQGKGTRVACRLWQRLSLDLTWKHQNILKGPGWGVRGSYRTENVQKLKRGRCRWLISGSGDAI